jgi:hypothetical protein
MPPSKKRKHAEPEKDDGSYAEAAYWDKRYETQEGYHCWYYNFGDLLPLFEKTIGAEGLGEADILEIGCGDSPVVKGFADYGDKKKNRRHLVGIDISANVVNALKATQSTAQEVRYAIMDATSLSFAPTSFDLVIDKGTIDALMCEKNLSKRNKTCSAVTSEAFRVLDNRSGVFMLISHMQPEGSEFQEFLENCLLPVLQGYSDRSFSIESHTGVEGRAAVHVVRCAARREVRSSSRVGPAPVTFSITSYSEDEDDDDDDEEEDEEE